MGLVKAINHYQAQYQVRFSTYAVPLIMGEIRRFMRDDGAVKVARPLKELYAKAMKYARQYAADTGREPTIGEIAQALCSTPEEVSMSMEAARKPASLQAPLSDEAGKPAGPRRLPGALRRRKAIRRLTVCCCGSYWPVWSREKDRSSFADILWTKRKATWPKCCIFPKYRYPG